jgi:hypothetical protein
MNAESDWVEARLRRSFAIKADVPFEKTCESVISNWYDFLRYTTRTEARVELKEVLPMVAGIAKKVAGLTGFRYIAGLWLERLSTSLLWYPAKIHWSAPEEPGVREPQKGVPTWSWASWYGAVGMLQDEGSTVDDPNTNFKLTSYVMQPPCDDSRPFHYCHVSRAELGLEAYCFEVWCPTPCIGTYECPMTDIFDHNGLQVGTGYLELTLPELWSKEERPRKFTAIILKKRIEPSAGTFPVTYFLLAQEKTREGDKRFSRMGIGQTVDRLHGHVFPGFNYDGHERSNITLI